MKTIILGTAHGINVPGKHSPDLRLREWKYSREICHQVRDALVKLGVECIIDLEQDDEPSLSGRVALVNRMVAKHGECTYVSIHVNAASGDGKWHDASGFGVYVAPNASEQSRKLAATFHRHAVAMGLGGNRCYPPTGYYTRSLAVCRDTRCPAVLTENLFQDNRHDVDFLLSPQGMSAIVDLHVGAILDYLSRQ